MTSLEKLSEKTNIPEDRLVDVIQNPEDAHGADIVAIQKKLGVRIGTLDISVS